MELTHVTTRIANLAQDAEPWEAEFLVDTGAIDCMEPRDRLLQAGNARGAAEIATDEDCRCRTRSNPESEHAR